MKISFKGAARTVTGSKHIIELATGKKILLDCGMFQGEEEGRNEENNRHLGFDPKSIDYCILSHAHIDHSGLIPLLVKQGFNGPIYATQATIDLCEIMLVDSAHIQEEDVKYINRRRVQNEQEPLKPLYTTQDALDCLKYFVPVPYEKWVKIDDDIELCFTVIGHILGAGAINLRIKDNNQIKTLCYTGDIGRQHHKIIKNPKPFPQADYIITESTYGDRLHKPNTNAEEELLQIVIETCVEKRGKLIIPAFSLGRTQELVYTLDRLETFKKLPEVFVYVDSPLSTNATQILKNHPECYNKDVLKYMELDSDPFGFNRLRYIKDVEQSKLLNTIKEPCIIISASGMIEAGRIMHHVKNNISDPKNTILIVGYCAPNTLGAKLARGDKEVKIFGDTFKVKADIKVMDEYSAHGDYKEMIAYLSCQDPFKVKKMFLVHGDYEVQVKYREKLMEADFSNIIIPDKNATYEI
ncbi:MAG: MBL fold metallo-hydrolase [Vicingaceae bacterium]